MFILLSDFSLFDTMWTVDFEQFQDLPKVPKISNDLFNTIKETLNNPNLTKALNSGQL